MICGKGYALLHVPMLLSRLDLSVACLEMNNSRAQKESSYLSTRRHCLSKSLDVISLICKLREYWLFYVQEHSISGENLYVVIFVLLSILYFKTIWAISPIINLLSVNLILRYFSTISLVVYSFGRPMRCTSSQLVHLRLNSGIL